VTLRGYSVVLAALVALGCDRKSDPPPPPTPNVEAPTTQVPPPGSPVAAPTTSSTAAPVDVPTEEDFEEEAEREITADNLEAELDKLEREIGQ
jgi:hypothetical protein